MNPRERLETLRLIEELRDLFVKAELWIDGNIIEEIENTIDQIEEYVR